MADRKKIDYEAIEPGWRAGIKSPAQLAAEYTEATGIQVSRVAIIKHFEKAGIPRDMAAKVHAKADALVAEAAVTGEVSPETKLKQKAVLEASALDEAKVRISHRRDITRARSLSMSLLAELEAQTADVPALAELGELLRSEGDRGTDRLNDLYRAVISLPERTKTMKALSESLKNLVGMEREAYGIESGSGDLGGKGQVTVVVKRFSDA